MAKAEEGLRDIYDFIDMAQRETAIVQQTVDSAVLENFQITESNLYRKLQSSTVEGMVKKEKADREKKKREYIGPKAGRPQSMSMWETYQARKAIETDLKMRFIQKVSKQRTI